MSSAGHILDMIIRMKNNRALNEGRKLRHARIRKAYEKQIRKRKIYLKKNKLSDEEFKVLKQKIRNKIRVERIRKIIFTSIFTLFAMGLIVISIINYHRIIYFIKDLNNF